LTTTSRHAGVIIPLSSIPSRRSWGIGEISDLPDFGRWLSHAGLDVVQLLPVYEMEHAHNSPYAALTAMAIDPVFVSLADHPDFLDAGGEEALAPDARDALADARKATGVNYAAARHAKTAALRASFECFNSGRAAARKDDFEAFLARDAWWLDDYTLFRALHDENGERYWRDWDPGVRDRRDDALRAVRARLSGPIRYYAYVQWIADEQWRRARRDNGSVHIYGDFPFMVSGHSADIWSRQHDFRLDASVGVPPDATSPEGQDWGLPVYRWDVSAATDHEWLRLRARRAAALFDGFRVDHLVGFFRTYVWERDGSAAFSPPDESDQLRQGESILNVLRGAGADIVAEDLGTVPDFVRESLERLRVPGLKVLRWERWWDEPEQEFRDPADYPPVSVAMTGTHDTETLAEWWDAATVDERRLCAAVPSMRAAGLTSQAFSPAVRDALIRGLFAAPSQLVLLPVQDIFGWRERINIPGLVGAGNWTWRLPWPVENLLVEPTALERAAFVRSLRR
jgi:4-alpha-glucanotransferase